MKSVATLLILLLICFENIAGEKMNELIDVITGDIWELAEGVHNEIPLVIRFRSELTKNSNISNHPQLIKIYWKYSSLKSITGMPSESDNKQMEIFENRLVKVLESDLSGILTSVVTTNGTREWVIYTKSKDLFSEKLHEMPQEIKPYPISIETEKDLNWGYFFNRVKPVE